MPEAFSELILEAHESLNKIQEETWVTQRYWKGLLAQLIAERDKYIRTTTTGTTIGVAVLGWMISPALALCGPLAGMKGHDKFYQEFHRIYDPVIKEVQRKCNQDTPRLS